MILEGGVECSVVRCTAVAQPRPGNYGHARVEFISTRAVASQENEQDVLCLSINPNGVFRFKPEI